MAHGKRSIDFVKENAGVATLQLRESQSDFVRGDDPDVACGVFGLMVAIATQNGNLRIDRTRLSMGEGSLQTIYEQMESAVMRIAQFGGPGIHRDGIEMATIHRCAGILYDEDKFRASTLPLTANNRQAWQLILQSNPERQNLGDSPSDCLQFLLTQDTYCVVLLVFKSVSFVIDSHKRENRPGGQVVRLKRDVDICQVLSDFVFPQPEKDAKWNLGKVELPGNLPEVAPYHVSVRWTDQMVILLLKNVCSQRKVKAAPASMAAMYQGSIEKFRQTYDEIPDEKIHDKLQAIRDEFSGREHVIGVVVNNEELEKWIKRYVNKVKREGEGEQRQRGE